MVSSIFLHGLETNEVSSSPKAVATIDTGVIAVIGTAPLADDELWPSDKVVQVNGGSYAGLGLTGTIADALDDIFDQTGKISPVVVVVRVEEGDTVAETMSNIIGNAATRTGMHALRNAKSELNVVPKLLIAPGYTSQRPTDGVKTIEKSTNGVGYTSAPTVTISGGGGSGAEAVATIGTDGTLAAIAVTKPGFGYTAAPTVTLTGGGGTTQATATATLGTVANPVTMELLTLAAKFRAGVVKDSTATTYADAVADRLDYDSGRLLIVEPKVKKFIDSAVVSRPASPSIAGLQAFVDYSDGFWVSPSNHVVQGIVGASRAIEHSINDASVESQQLNKNDIACIVRAPSGGFKLWGNRVPFSDTNAKFWAVRRAHDTIIDSIEAASEQFIDKPFSVQNLVEIAETVNSALRRWAAMGATLGGKVWLPTDLNTAETWVSGQLYIGYDAEAPAPMEHITFIFSRNTGYYETLAASAVKEINRLTSSVSE